MNAPTSKWFPDLTADVSPGEAARIVLTARCATVHDQLERLAARMDDDTHSVHQTRVATRRLAAALSVFEEWVNPVAGRRLRKAGARIRRAAGAVRDLDVGLGLLRERLEREHWMPPALGGQMVECLEEQRGKGMRALLGDLEKLTTRFERATKEVIEELRAGRLDLCGQPGSLGGLAGVVLGEKLEGLAAAGSNDLSDADNVHQLRIAGKRLRYAMEVFAGCFPASFRDELYGEVEGLQGELGDLNDLRHLYARLVELRSSLAAHRGRDEREEIKSLCDRFTAVVGHEWITRQEAFARRWTRDGGQDLAGRFRAALIREGDLRSESSEGIKVPSAGGRQAVR